VVHNVRLVHGDDEGQLGLVENTACVQHVLKKSQITMYILAVQRTIFRPKENQNKPLIPIVHMYLYIPTFLSQFLAPFSVANYLIQQVNGKFL
jgi:hypothetical protein